MENGLDIQLREELLRTLYKLRLGIRMFLQPHNLTLQQYQILEIIDGNERELPLTTKEISIQMVDQFADTSRVVDRLIKRGLLVKKKCTIDARKIRVELTIRGKDVAQRLTYESHKLNELTSGLNKVEKGWLVDLLGKLNLDLREETRT